MSHPIEKILDWQAETITFAIIASGGTMPVDFQVGVIALEINERVQGNRNENKQMTYRDARLIIESTILWCAEKIEGKKHLH